MPGKTRKCAFIIGKQNKCLHGGEGLVTEMIKAKKTPKGKEVYFHKDCYEEFKKHQEQKELELAEWDALLRCIADIHGVPSVDPSFLYLLQDLRNGTVRFDNKRAVNRYKEGVPYSLIWEAYEASRKAIAHAKRNIGFKSVRSELIYGYKIMTSKLSDIIRQHKKREAEQARREQEEQYKAENILVVHDAEDEQPIVYKKKPKVDISRFLD